jgi:uncharacterized protein YjiS (DUF1127 family)
VGYADRLTAEQIAALAPGDTVTIESGADISRPRHTTGTIVRIGTTHLVVSVPGLRGGTFVERYSLRDGIREGGGRAELVSPSEDTTPARRRTQRIDVAYRQWSRRRSDVDALRELRDAVSEQLEKVPTN